MIKKISANMNKYRQQDSSANLNLEEAKMWAGKEYSKLRIAAYLVSFILISITLSIPLWSTQAHVTRTRPPISLEDLGQPIRSPRSNSVVVKQLDHNVSQPAFEALKKGIKDAKDTLVKYTGLDSRPLFKSPYLVSRPMRDRSRVGDHTEQAGLASATIGDPLENLRHLAGSE